MTAALPPVGDVVAALERAVVGETEAPAGDVLALVVELLKSNLRQWDLEDATRDPEADDAVVASAKRAIDVLNLSRHRLVQQIDVAVDRELGQSPTATLVTETPGMVFDRLSVLIIRIVRTRAASEADVAGGYADRLPRLERQLVSLSTALEALLREVGDGTRRFLPYEHLKLYEPGRGRGADNRPD